MEGELEALLVTMAPAPETVPVDVGANVTVNVAVFPGVTYCPTDMPLTLNPAPDTLTFETVMLDVPEFVKTTFCALLVPTVTFPKLMLRVFGVSATGGAALTMRVAALLVALPAVLLTTTVNCAPLFAVVSAGVV